MTELILTNENFDEEVLKSDKPVIVDFWAPWCGPCQMMGPVFEKLAEESDGSYIVGKVNVEYEEELAIRFQIRSIPAIKVFKNGEVATSSIGATSYEKLLEMVKSV